MTLLGELEKLKKEWNVLETECRSLKKENVLLSSELQRQEKELHKYVKFPLTYRYLLLIFMKIKF